MILYKERLTDLRYNVINYITVQIKNIEQFTIEPTIWQHGINDSSLHFINRIFVEKGKVYADTVWPKVREPWLFALEELSIENLCEIADRLHLSPLKQPL